MRRRNRGVSRVDDLELAMLHPATGDMLIQGVPVAQIAHLILGPSYAVRAFRSNAEMVEVATQFRAALTVEDRRWPRTWAQQTLWKEQQ